MKAKLLADDSIELDGSPQEVTRVIVEAYARTRNVHTISPSISAKPLLIDLSKADLAGKKEVPAGDPIRRHNKQSKTRPRTKSRSTERRGAWTDEQIAVLRAEKAKGTSTKVIGKMLGRSAMSVSVEASKLGIKRSPRKGGKLSNWTTEKESKFRVEAPYKTVPELCRMFKCSENEINKRLVALKNED